jgi:hypothetical protein
MPLVEPHDQRIRHFLKQLDVMRRDHHGRPQTIERFEQADELQRHFGIDVSGRLVRDEEIGATNHGPRDRNALLLAA